MNKTAKNSMIYFAGTVIMGFMGLLGSMILTRYLSQTVYALYGLLTTFHTAVTMFTSFGFDSSYMRFYYNHGYSPRRYLLMCVKYPLLIFIGITLIIIEPGQHLIKFIFGMEFPVFTIIILIGYLLVSFIHRFIQLTARMEEFAFNYVLTNFIGKSGFLIFVLLAFYAFKFVTFDFVLLSFFLSGIIAILINLTVFNKIKNRINPNPEKLTQNDLFNYGFPLMINNVIILIVPMLEKIIIRNVAGWDILSIFTAASIFQTVIMLIVTTATNIWNPLVFKHCENEKKFKPILHTFGLIGVIVLALATAGCILLRRWLVLILDSSYYSVYIIAPTIMLASCFNLLALIYSVGINIVKKTVHLIVGPIIQIVVSLGLCYLLIPKLQLIGVGLAVLISIGVSKMYRVVVGMMLYNTGVSEVKAILLVAVAVAGAVISLFFTTLTSDIIVSLSIIVLIFVIINKEIKPIFEFCINLIMPNKSRR